MRQKVFVYGTLMSGEGNHRLLDHNGARLLGPAVTAPSFDLVSLGGFPAMFADGDTAIAGELYEVDAATLEDLDRLEGHPRFYRRQRIALADGARVEAYVLPRDSFAAERATPIASGDWRTVRREIWR